MKSNQPKRLPRGLAIVFALVGLLVTSTALADALVVAQVRAESGPAEGQVILDAVGSPHQYTCETSAGECRMENVPGGRYIVRFVPRGGGESPEPRAVVVPPEGRVTLHVSAR